MRLKTMVVLPLLESPAITLTPRRKHSPSTSISRGVGFACAAVRHGRLSSLPRGGASPCRSRNMVLSSGAGFAGASGSPEPDAASPLTSGAGGPADKGLSVIDGTRFFRDDELRRAGTEPSSLAVAGFLPRPLFPLALLTMSASL